MKFHDHTLDDLQRWDGTLAGLKLAVRLATMLALAYPRGSRYEGSFLAHLSRAVEWGGGPFNLATAVMTLVILAVAGYLSVEFLLATGIRRLLLDRVAGWDRVKRDPGSVPLFLQEMRRAEPALSVVDRFAKQDVSIDNITIPKGSRVFGVLASANRDELIYVTDPDKFNPDRPFPKPQLGLGWGTHICMGRCLENSITRPTIEQLVKAMPSLRLQSDAQPPWFENFYFRSFDHLAVTLK
jgi:cytochrome P450